MVDNKPQVLTNRIKLKLLNCNVQPQNICTIKKNTTVHKWPSELIINGSDQRILKVDACIMK